MALNPATLDELVRGGYGPVALEATSGGYRTGWAHHPVAVSLEGATVKLVAERSVRWPTSSLAAEEVDRRVARAIAEVTVDRPELVTVEGVAARSVAVVTLWIDAERSGPHDLAAAVRSVVSISDLVEWAVEAAGLRLTAEGQLAELGVSADRDLEESLEQWAEAERAPVEVPDMGPDRGDTEPVTEVARPATAAGHPSEPAAAWCYVLTATDVLDPKDTTATIGRLEPGQWYRVVAEQQGWTRVAAVDGSLEGWAQTRLIHRREQG